MLIKLSNTFKALADNAAGIAAYHFGYHSDINRGIPNVYNQNGLFGPYYPLLLWTAPVDLEPRLNTNSGSDVVNVELYVYDLQNYTMSGDTKPETMLEGWDRLHRTARGLMHALKDSRVGTLSEIKYFTDANAHTDGLICVGITFKLSMSYGCDDYDAIATVDFATMNDENELEYGG